MALNGKLRGQIYVFLYQNLKELKVLVSKYNDLIYVFLYQNLKVHGRGLAARNTCDLCISILEFKVYMDK